MKRRLVHFFLSFACVYAVEAQDILVLKNGEVKSVYNVEVGKESIFYTVESKASAAIHKIEKKDVFTIKKNDEVALVDGCEVVGKSVHTSIEKSSVAGTGSSSLEFSYIPITFDIKDNEYDATGYSLIISEVYNLSKQYPLFLRVGLGIQYMNMVDDYWINDSEVHLIALRCPVSIGFKFLLNKDFAISPYAGFNFKWNVGGWITLDSQIRYDLFKDNNDRNSMGNNAWDRFQYALNFGVGLEYKRAGMGISYSKDIDDIAFRMNMSAVYINLSYNFCLFNRPSKYK